MGKTNLRLMKLIMKILLLILVVVFFPYNSQAQCPGTAITFTANSSSKPDTVWQSITTTRSGLVCGDTVATNKAISFIVTINPLTTHVEFNIISGAIAGAMYYRINCGPQIPISTPACVSGLSTFCLSFTKPGNGSNMYEITAIKDANLNTIDTTITINGAMLTSNQTGASYQWLDCSSAFTPILTETNQNFSALVNGDYAVKVTFAGCVDTSACININNINIAAENSNINTEILVYPNPIRDFLNVELPFQNNNIQFEIENTLGQKVYKTKTSRISNIIDLKQLENGIYLLKVYAEGQLIRTKKFVKE